MEKEYKGLRLWEDVYAEQFKNPIAKTVARGLARDHIKRSLCELSKHLPYDTGAIEGDGFNSEKGLKVKKEE